MTKNEWLVEFMRIKNKILVDWLEEKGEEIIYLTNEKDIEELETWEEEICANIVHGISTWLDNKEGGDSAICPWCYRFFEEDMQCMRCTYGKRHGICLDNPYSEISFRLGNTYICYIIINEWKAGKAFNHLKEEL